MSYLTISYTHKNTDLDTREKLAFSSDELKNSFTSELLMQDYIQEVMLTSTCNRVELFMFVKDIKQALSFAIDGLSRHSNISYEVLFSRANIYEKQDAIYHMFVVASSLDSLIVGETQIIGQIKDAYKFSVEHDKCEKNITLAINYALRCATAVRNATSLGEGQVSVASAAVAMAKDIFKTTKPQAVVVGAGKMSQIAMRHLLKNGFDIKIINRNYTNATNLKAIIIDEKPRYEENITIEKFENLHELLGSAELLFTATASTDTIIKAQHIQPSNTTRYWFDMAVPRDIHRVDMANLHIYAVDDLKAQIDENIALRQSKAKQGYKIVKDMQKEFYRCLEDTKLQPIIKQLHQKAQAIIDKKLTQAIGKKFIDKDQEANTKKLCQTVVAQLLHDPTVHLKSNTKELDYEQISQCFINSFKLN